MTVSRVVSMRTVFQHAHGVSLRLARMFPLLFFVASRPFSPRGHVVVVGVVAVVRAFLVVVAGAAGSGELLVAVAGAAAGVELLVAVAGAAAGVGSR